MKLREEYQEPAHKESIKWCKNNLAAAIHEQSVGAGKTVQIAFFAKHVSDKGGSVLNLSRQGELCEQNSNDAWLIGLKNSIYCGSLNQKSTAYNVIYGTERTVFNDLKTKFRDRKYDLIQIDECHEFDWKDGLEAIKEMKKGEDFYNKEHSQYAVIIAHFMKNNPKTRFLGYSGSPFRGSEDIVQIGGFWQKRLSHVTTYFLVGIGYLVPPVFGFGDNSHTYTSSKKFKPSKKADDSDFSNSEMAKMQKEFLKEKNITESIIEEVIQRTKDRNGVLITCAGKKHCEQVAEYLPKGSYGIVTDETGFKKRSEILKKADRMEIKYVLQVNCLGQGVNIPAWDTCVILRRIGSKRYLIQLMGRVFRLLKEKHEELGMIKDDGLVLDYTGTIEAMGEIFPDDPMMEIAFTELSKSKEDVQTQSCRLCGTENSMYAVRCIGADNTQPDGRCEHFFQFAVCQNCETKNAPSAQSCRNCDAVMIDPALKLKGKAYTDAEYKPVKEVQFYRSESKGAKGFWVAYHLDSFVNVNGEQRPEIAKEHLDPFSSDFVKRRAWDKFLRQHINCPRMRSQVGKQFRTVSEILKSKSVFDTPTHITHRIDPKKFTSIIARKKFRSGREEE